MKFTDSLIKALATGQPDTQLAAASLLEIGVRDPRTPAGIRICPDAIEVRQDFWDEGELMGVNFGNKARNSVVTLVGAFYLMMDNIQMARLWKTNKYHYMNRGFDKDDFFQVVMAVGVLFYTHRLKALSGRGIDAMFFTRVWKHIEGELAKNPMPTDIIGSVERHSQSLEEIIHEVMMSMPEAPQIEGMPFEMSDEADDSLESAERRQAVVNASVSQSYGTGSVFQDLPHDPNDLIKPPVIDWKTELRQWLSSNGSSAPELSYDEPYLEFLAQPDAPLIAPYFVGQGVGEMGVIADLSGSMFFNETRMQEVCSELQGVISSVGYDALHLLPMEYEAHAQHMVSLQVGEPIPWELFKGGGGTNFAPPIDYFKERFGSSLTVCLFLTDGEGPCETAPPPFPVVWLITSDGDAEKPFGRVIQVPRSS